MKARVNTDKRGNEFHNYGSGSERVVVYVPKNGGSPAAFDNKRKLNK